MTLARPAYADLPGAPESRLAHAVRRRLPDTGPPPPWPCRVEAVLWWHRARPAARLVLPAALPAGAGPAYVVGAFVRYLDSPVGPYDEVIGAVLPGPRGLRRPGLHIPFIAVDSLHSVQGGRARWALPKALASFSRTSPAPGDDEEVVADGDRWRVAARPRPVGPRLPVVGRLPGTQVDAEGRTVRSTTTGYGLARLARVAVQVGTDLAGEPGSIAGWLRSGRHHGLVLRARLWVR